MPVIHLPTGFNANYCAFSDINALILDYLTAEGYAAAAERFSKEANLKPVEEHDSVKRRQQIQHEILRGSIQSAIEMINDVNPEVSSIPNISYTLLRLFRAMNALYISLRTLDETKLYFSPQYEQDHNTTFCD